MKKEHNHTIETLISSIGKSTDSPHLINLFSRLNAVKKDLKKYPMQLPGRRLWADDFLGLQLEFKDIGLLENVPYHDLDEGPFILTKLVFWGNRKKKPLYSGPLPYGLDFDMTREDIRKSLLDKGLGEASTLGFSGEVDVWSLDNLELTAEYPEGDDIIRCIAIGLIISRDDL
ncbi:hypothetical protein EDP1_2637 [Pseudomonas putida S610]|uniref:hypothetical protein n=1 Tax=Pseudomonas putida TaxID=303 RepID=UPI0003C58951|nr:hypothetical protein [Pseudomonas putida]EST16494.1 hypothetical protein EDP1_2637 [Pseudomonas putida S610]